MRVCSAFHFKKKPNKASLPDMMPYNATQLFFTSSYPVVQVLALGSQGTECKRNRQTFRTLLMRCNHITREGGFYVHRAWRDIAERYAT